MNLATAKERYHQLKCLNEETGLEWFFDETFFQTSFLVSENIPDMRAVLFLYSKPTWRAELRIQSVSLGTWNYSIFEEAPSAIFEQLKQIFVRFSK